MYKKLFTALLYCSFEEVLIIVIYQMDQDQYSNVTRPSTNHRSQDHYEPQTNTSQHNTLLSQARISQQNQTQHEVQPISPNQPQSQQLNSHKVLIEQIYVSVTQRVVFHSHIIENQNVPNQQNQLQAKQHHQTEQRPQLDNNQKVEDKSEKKILIDDYKEEVSGTANLNTEHVQNYNQNNQVYIEKEEPFINTETQANPMDSGFIIQEQIQNQGLQGIPQKQEQNIVQDQPQLFQKDEPLPMDIQAGFTKDIPMDIESESRCYLTDKQSHKSHKIYNQIQKELQNQQQQKRSNISQKSDIEQVHFYEEKMPQNNSNLFKFGFTISSKKRNSNLIKSPSIQSQRLELANQDKSKQNQKDIYIIEKSKFQNKNIFENRNEQQKAQSDNNDVLLKASSQKSQKQSKHSQINPIQQVYIQNNIHSPRKQSFQKQEQTEEIVQNHEVKDQLPSEIPYDQFQPLSDSFKGHPVPQIEFENISDISKNEKRNQYKLHEVHSREENNNFYSQKQNNEIKSPQTVINQLRHIHQNKIQYSDEYNFQLLENLTKKHINLITLKSIDSIGHIILENGQSAIMFIDLFVLNSPNTEDRKIFHKYLAFSLSHNVNENKQIYQQYRQKFWPRKSEKFTIIDSFNLKNSPKKQQKNQQQHEIEQNYSVEVHDTSVHHGPKSIMKTNNKLRIKEPRTEMPVKRNRADLPKSEYNQSNEKETKNILGSFQKGKKVKSTKKRVNVKKQDTPEKNEKLGYAETFVTVEDKNGNQVLQTRKVSLRLLQKSNKQKSHSKQIKKSKSKPKRKNGFKEQTQPRTQEENRRNSPNASAKKRRISIRRSVRETQGREQILTLDYVKSHFQELKIDPTHLKMLTGTPLTEADRQIAKMLEQYQKISKQQERLALDLQVSHQMVPIQESQQNYNEEQDTHNPISMQRIREIQQQLQKNKLKKYKIMQQLTQKHIVIDTIIDPDINQHGIYALVKVSKMTSVFCGALYFLIPMSKLQLCSRDQIDQDIRTIKSLVQENERDNIGILKPSSKLQDAIQAQKIKRAKQQKKK